MERYRIVDKLGHGTDGIVRKAIDSLDGSLVAIKSSVTDDEHPADDGVHYRVLREVAILRSLPPHRHVVRLRDVQMDDSGTHLVFECMRCDLGAFLSSQKGDSLQPAQVRSLSAQLLSGLAHLHSQRIVHRDLKPQNILISCSGRSEKRDLRFLVQAVS